jgi:hypothetical protein
MQEHRSVSTYTLLLAFIFQSGLSKRTMRFSTLSISLSAFANIAFALDFMAPLQCLKMKNTAENIDTDHVTEMWMEVVCKRCQPKLSDYGSVLRDGVFVPFVEAASQSMGTSELSPHYIALLDSFFEIAKDECGATDSMDLCQDPSQVKSLAKCVQGHSWSFILRNAPTFLPILLANPCGKQMDYLSSPDLLDSILPAYMNGYAESC